MSSCYIETSPGGKIPSLSKYDLRRKPHKAINDSSEITISTRMLSSELCCPICLDLLTTTMATKECLHRFCCECITTALLRGNKECPTCRKKLVSKRSLRPDPNLDALINKIWPDRKAYDMMQQKAMDMFHQQCNVGALQQGIQAGLRAQAMNRRRRVQGSNRKKKVVRRPSLLDRSANSTPDTASNFSEDAAVEIEEDDVERQVVSGQGSSEVVNACGTGSSVQPISFESFQTVNPLSLSDRTQKWLEDNPFSPSTPDDNVAFQIRRKVDDDGIMLELDDTLFYTEDMNFEVELLPTKSLNERSASIAPFVLVRHFIKSKGDTKISHLCEFLYRTWCGEYKNLEEQCNMDKKRITNLNGSSSFCLLPESWNVQRPSQFFVIRQADGQSVKMLDHLTLLEAFRIQKGNCHLMLYFDLND